MSTIATAARRPNTTRHGTPFDAATVQAVWNKAQIFHGTDPAIRRKDLCGAIIDRAAYGNTAENGTGWEVDHIKPVAKGGGDELSNLQPLHWKNNRAKGDSYPPNNFCVVTAAR